MYKCLAVQDCSGVWSYNRVFRCLGVKFQQQQPLPGSGSIFHLDSPFQTSGLSAVSLWDCLTAATALTGRAVPPDGGRRLQQLDRLPPRIRTTPASAPRAHRKNTNPEESPLRAAMRDHSRTATSDGACMPCCQVCVYAFTAFLIIAERTARESYLGRARARPRTNDETDFYVAVMECVCASVCVCRVIIKLTPAAVMDARCGDATDRIETHRMY